MSAKLSAIGAKQSPMSEPRDQPARDMATRAIALIEQHQAVCVEAEKRRMAFQEHIEGWMKRIQESYEAGQADISHRHSIAINSIGDNLGQTNSALMQRMD